MAEPVVKRWWQPTVWSLFPIKFAQAFNTMHEGRRGPVLVDIPQDLQAEYGEYTPPPAGMRRAATPADSVIPWPSGGLQRCWRAPSGRSFWLAAE